MKRLIIDIQDDRLATNIALLASRKGMSIEDYVIFVLADDVHIAFQRDLEFRRAEDQYMEEL